MRPPRQQYADELGAHHHEIGAKRVRAHQVAVERHRQRAALSQHDPGARGASQCRVGASGRDQRIREPADEWQDKKESEDRRRGHETPVRDLPEGQRRQRQHEGCERRLRAGEETQSREKPGERHDLQALALECHLPCVERRHAEDETVRGFVREGIDEIEVGDLRVTAESEDRDVDERTQERGGAARGNERDSIDQDGQEGGENRVRNSHRDDAGREQPEEKSVEMLGKRAVRVFDVPVKRGSLVHQPRDVEIAPEIQERVRPAPPCDGQKRAEESG